MKATAWQWFIWAVSILVLARFAYEAFSVPWNWTFEQCLMIFVLVMALIWLGAWMSIWARGGKNAVKDHWRVVQHIGAKPPPIRTFIKRIAIWFFLAILLVVVFQLLKR
jgi:hypothetical protein